MPAWAQLGRKNPDITPYLSLQGTSTGRKKVCWDNDLGASRRWKAFFLNFGNGLVKQGDIDTGRVMYENARHAKNTDHGRIAITWTPFWPRISPRARRFMPTPIPTTIRPMTAPGSTCTYCHATVAPH